MNNNCTYFEDLLSARLDGDLSPQEERELTEHLDACPACRAYAHQLLTLRQDLSALSATPPAGFAPSVMEALDHQVVIPLPTAKPAKRRRWPALAAAVVLVVALAGGVPLFHGAGESEEAATAESAADLSPQEPAETAPTEGAPAGGDAKPQAAPAEEESLPESEVVADKETGRVESNVSPLTQDDALEAVTDYLSARGKTYALSPKGLSEDGTHWLIFAEDPSQKVTALYAVDRLTGEVREEFVAMERPPA